VKNDGTLTAWEFHNYNSGGAGIQIKYDIPNNDIRFHASDSPLKQGSYRGLAATANHFARESHIDELAHLVGIDPLEFRLKNIKDERLRAVLQAAANKFGWKPIPRVPPATTSGVWVQAGRPTNLPVSDRGVGIACGFEKGGYVATAPRSRLNRRATRKIKRTGACASCASWKHLNAAPS
jgi:isoquinoline 1-oxidoreductase